MKKNKYISTTESAKMLGISREAVLKKIKTGHLKAEKIGRNFAVPKSEIEQLIKPKLTDRDKRKIDQAVNKTVREYGETLKLLGNA